MHIRVLASFVLFASLLWGSSAAALDDVTLTLANGQQVVGKLVENVPGERIVVRGKDRIWRFTGAATQTVRVTPLASSAGAGASPAVSPEPIAAAPAAPASSPSSEALTSGASNSQVEATPGAPAYGPYTTPTESRPRSRSTSVALPSVLLALGAVSMVAGGVAWGGSARKNCEYYTWGSECGFANSGARIAGKGAVFGGAALMAIGLVVLPVRMIARARAEEASNRSLAQRTTLSPWYASDRKSGTNLGLSGTLSF